MQLEINYIEVSGFITAWYVAILALEQLHVLVLEVHLIQQDVHVRVFKSSADSQYVSQC